MDDSKGDSKGDKDRIVLLIPVKNTLNPRQERFCQEYAISQNAASSARIAGFSNESAKYIGCGLLKKPEIIDRINEIIQPLSSQYNITRERITNNILKIAEPIAGKGKAPTDSNILKANELLIKMYGLNIVADSDDVGDEIIEFNEERTYETNIQAI